MEEILKMIAKYGVPIFITGLFLYYSKNIFKYIENVLNDSRQQTKDLAKVIEKNNFNYCKSEEQLKNHDQDTKESFKEIDKNFETLKDRLEQLQADTVTKEMFTDLKRQVEDIIKK